ncbi:MAG: hypothetical protein MUF58_14345 [Arcicella sp.]|jgi:predicted RNA-binding Zn-ribbon protein involved in translation (DUF1610 family)|nr:hypothetical protein [Arcicella sp.]
MKKKYICHACGKENIIDIENIIKMGLGGMGGSGVMANEMGINVLLSNSNLFSSGFRIPNNAKEFKHTCSHCKAENIVKTS